MWILIIWKEIQRIWDYPVNQREEVRRAYLNLGPYQIHLKEYPAKGSIKHPRRFQYSWFKVFPNWLEYSPTTNAAYCFICYLFCDKPNVRHGSDAFTVNGFDKWKKVNDGKRCAFLKHISCSQHKDALAFTENFLNSEAHIGNILEKQSVEQIMKNRKRLKASIDIVRWLTFQACAFRGRDEKPNSANRGNFLQLLKLLASYNDELSQIVLNAPYNSKYTSGKIQKEILSIIANKVRKHIRSEVGDSYFCVMVDESRDESKKEQMAIVLRFVDTNGVIKQRFLDLVHVSDTSALTLKTNLWKSFEFVFILHLMKEIMGKTDILCQALQKTTQDIFNAIELVSATKESLNEFKNNGWNSFFAQVKMFSQKHQIDMPDMNAPYKSSRYRPRQQDNHVTFEHYYRVDIFMSALDTQLHELNNRFNDQAMELLTLSSTFGPNKVFNIDDICLLVEKCYPADFTEQERLQLKYELELFAIEKQKNTRLSGAATIAKLCEILVELNKRETYSLLDRLMRLILTLPVSTATTERSFSAMKLFKNRLRNKMANKFLADNLVIHIEKDIADTFDSKSVIEEFKNLKGRKAEL